MDARRAGGFALAGLFVLTSARAGELVDHSLTARFDPARGTVAVQARLEVPRAILDGHDQLQLVVPSRIRRDPDSAGPRIELEGSTWTIERQDDDLYLLRAPMTSSGSQSLIVDMEYEVLFDPGIHDTLGYDAFFATDRSSIWYPDILVPGTGGARFGDFTLELTYPAGYAVLTSGRRLGSPQRVGGSLRERFRAAHVEGFALNIARGYLINENRQDGFTILTLCPPEMEGALMRAAELTVDAARWYRKTYGFLPFTVMGIAPGHPGYWGGFPSSNIYYLHLGNTSEEFLRRITAHELGHYYWGRYVLSDSARDLDWLMLANGIWIDQLFLAQTEGRTIEEQWRRSDWFRLFTTVMVGAFDQRLEISPEEEQSSGFDYNTLIRHAKGAVGVYLQARLIGTEAFLNFQRALLEEYRYRHLSPQEFSMRLEGAGAAGARAFFRQWIRGPVEIGYSIDSVKSTRAEGGWRHEISMSPLGAPPYPVDVVVRDDEGALVPGNTTVLSANGVLELHSAGRLEAVLIDPGGSLPIRNSSHPEIQRLFVMAMMKAGHADSFEALGRKYLEDHPEDQAVRLSLASRFLAVAREGDAMDLLDAGRAGSWTCDEAASCRLEILRARSLARTGENHAAELSLARIKTGAESLDLQEEWITAWQETITLSGARSARP